MDGYELLANSPKIHVYRKHKEAGSTLSTKIVATNLPFNFETMIKLYSDIEARSENSPKIELGKIIETVDEYVSILCTVTLTLTTQRT